LVFRLRDSPFFLGVTFPPPFVAGSEVKSFFFRFLLYSASPFSDRTVPMPSTVKTVSFSFSYSLFSEMSVTLISFRFLMFLDIHFIFKKRRTPPSPLMESFPLFVLPTCVFLASVVPFGPCVLPLPYSDQFTRPFPPVPLRTSFSP